MFTHRRFFYYQACFSQALDRAAPAPQFNVGDTCSLSEIECWRHVLAKRSIFASVSVQPDPPLAATLQTRKLRAFASHFFTNKEASTNIHQHRTNIELGGGGGDLLTQW